MDVCCNAQDGTIFVVNQNWTVQVFNLAGRLIRELKIKHRENVIMNFARISFSPITERVTVVAGGTDGQYSYSGIQVYTRDLELRRQTQLSLPNLGWQGLKRCCLLSVVFSERGFIFIETDDGIKLYNNQAECINSFENYNFTRVGQTLYEDILIKDIGQEFSQLFDAYSIRKSNLGDSETRMKWAGRVYIDKFVNRFLCDYFSHQVLLFNGEGKLIKTIGCYGSGVGQLDQPVGMCILKDRILVADYGNDKIQIFSTQ